MQADSVDAPVGLALESAAVDRMSCRDPRALPLLLDRGEGRGEESKELPGPRIFGILEAIQKHAGKAGVRLGQTFRARPELLVFVGLLVLCNWPLLLGPASGSLIFLPAAVEAGEWWRLFTHPWVHVTWYHLFLDGAAFLMLYQGLGERSLARRLTCVLAAGAGGLLVSWWAAPAMGSRGLCGLSGVAHGLMAVSALELMAGQPWRSTQGRLGLCTFVLVVGKALIEAVSGRMFFTSLHFGLMGDPVAVSHAGGVLGGLLAASLPARRCNRSGSGNRSGSHLHI